MYKPYALAPCGHLACYDCLVNWFKAPPPDDRPELPVLLRKKTCPHCRGVVKDRPIQVWGMKDIVDSFVKSGLLIGNFLPPAEVTSNANENSDPWDGIFRKPVEHGLERYLGGAIGGAGILDDEDGGVYRCYDCLHEIWDGVCSGCGRGYPGIDGEDDDDFEIHDVDSDDEDVDDDDGFHGGMGWMGLGHLPGEPLHEAMAAQARLNEIAVNQAENYHAAMHGVLAGHWSDDGEGDSVDDDAQEVDGEEDDGEGYESSFIDDENNAGIVPLLAPRLRGEEVIELTSGSEDDVPMYRRRASQARRDPIEVSDEDEIEDIRGPARSRGQPRRRRAGAGHIVVRSDDDDDEIAPGPSTSAATSQRAVGRNRQIVVSSDEEDHDSNGDDGVDP